MAKNGFSMSNRVAVEEVTAGSTKTLTVDDCGKFFYIATITKVVKIVSADANLVYGGVTVAAISGAVGDNPGAGYFKSGASTNITLASGGLGGQGKGFMGSSVTITACVLADGITSVWAVEGNLATSGTNGHTTPFS